MTSAAEGPTGGGDSGEFRLLVVTTDPHVGEAVHREVERRAQGREVRAMVVIPAVVGSRFQHAAGAVDDAVAAVAEQREEVRHEVEDEVTTIFGEPRIGDSDPLLAIADALREFGEADEILIVTRPEDQAGWLEDDLFERAREQFRQPIVHFVLDPRQDDEIVATERADEGHETPAADEVEGQSENMPRYSARDLLGMAVAVVGTIVLVVLAASCGEGFSSEGGLTEGGLSGCAGRLLLAGALGLVNLAHIVGLLLFQTVGYRGFWDRAFETLSLVGTPLAVIASLLLDA